jgi:hypothetical protein
MEPDDRGKTRVVDRSTRDTCEQKPDLSEDGQRHGARYKSYEVDGEWFAVFGDKLWSFVGRTANARTLATVDGVAWNGALLTVHTDGGLIQLQHPIGGVEETFVGSDWLDESVPMYEEVTPVDW